MSNSIKQILPIYESYMENFREQHDNHLLKFKKMQDFYLSKNAKLYSEKSIQKINYKYEIIFHKSLLRSLHLEQLWAMSDYFRNDLLLDLDNLPSEVKWNDTHLIIGNMYLEAYLFQARSFIDFYMAYICILLGSEKIGFMTRRNFKRKLKNSPKYFQEKAVNILRYFTTKVFKKGEWGSLLKILRDRVSHKDKLKTEYDGDEVLLDKVRLNWPTVNGLTYERFCQSIDNGIFEMLVETSEILFDIEWKAGPYTVVSWA